MCPSSNEGEVASTPAEGVTEAESPQSTRGPTPYWLRANDPAAFMAAPCVTYAVAFTVGILFDHFFGLRLLWTFLVAGTCAFAWFISRIGHRIVAVQLGYLYLIIASLGAAHHRVWLSDEGPDDICRLTDERPRPIQVRGIIEQEPIEIQPANSDHLRTQPASARFRSVLHVTSRKNDDGWRTASGRADLSVAAPLEDIHRGDEVEVVGRLQAFGPPMNPGEIDRAARANTRGIHSQIVVVKVARAVTRLGAGSTWSPRRKLDQLRGLGMRLLERYLPPDQVGLAGALLLGEDTALSADDWARYMRTGVVAVLVVSGQHLSLLAFWMWWLLCLANVPRQKSAIAVASVLLLYSFLTGGQPPILRAAVMSAVFCGSFLIRRPVLEINTFALAWLAVLVVNPTDLFSAGCQYSFLSVAVLFWGIRLWMRREQDPLDREIERAKPRLIQFGNRCIGEVKARYVAMLIFFAVLAPLVALNFHTFSWQALLIGPPVVFFSDFALAAGFLLLLTGAVLPPVAYLAAWVVRLSLYCCDGIVRLADRLPGGRIYFADLPVWWVLCFYVGLVIMLFGPRVPRIRYGLIVAALIWLCLGPILLDGKQATSDLRCTFLAVGHGGCAVIETPDGRVILYDIGAIGGPEVMRVHVQPFLWSRGIRSVDEVILSHADLDHFNGLPDLLDSFSVARVTCSPTFSNKEAPGVHHVVEGLRDRKVEMRIVVRGDTFRAGEVNFQVLHPPEQGPAGNENTRSLVLLIRHQGHSILLTGDLEGLGRAQVLAEPIEPIDVLMAPHHGSATVNDDRLAQWANPKVVISCEGPPRYQMRPNEPYSARGIKFFGTWPHGAITIRSSKFGMLLETFASEQRLVIRRD